MMKGMLAASIVVVMVVMSVMSISTIQVEGYAIDSRTEMGFQPYCDSGDCPSGPYEEGCPVCGQLHYGATTTLLQCFCFNSQKQLQDTSFIRGAQDCNKIDVTDAGAIVCSSSNPPQPQSGKGKGKKGRRALRRRMQAEKVEEEEKTKVEVTVENSLGEVEIEDSTAQNETETASPVQTSVNINVNVNVAANAVSGGLVDFEFYCPGGNCPEGSYKNLCARCVASVDTKPPNDPRPSLACRCFNEQGVMTAQVSTMWNFQLCPKISSHNGALQCDGAGKSSGVRIYTGRRLDAREMRSLDSFEVLESGEMIIPSL